MATLLYVTIYSTIILIFATLAEKVPAINKIIEKIVNKITEV